MFTGNPRSGPASHEVIDERVDDLGVLALAHALTMTCEVVQTTRQ
jgi:hypothetical protein